MENYIGYAIGILLLGSVFSVLRKQNYKTLGVMSVLLMALVFVFTLKLKSSPSEAKWCINAAILLLDLLSLATYSIAFFTYMNGRFDWKAHIEEIENHARENKKLKMYIPEKEWKRLEQENLESLRSLLSENAFSRLMLMDCEEPERYYILVAQLRCYR